MKNIKLEKYLNFLESRKFLKFKKSKNLKFSENHYGKISNFFWKIAIFKNLKFRKILDSI